MEMVLESQDLLTSHLLRNDIQTFFKLYTSGTPVEE